MAMRLSKRFLVIGTCTMIGLGVIGYDLSRLQSGLEAPSQDVVMRVYAQSEDFTPPPPISTYESADLAVTEDVTVRVYMRENPSASSNLLLIHGAGGGAWAWEEVFDQLPGNHNLYALSWRGHFDSSPVQDANSSDYVQDQLAVLRWIQDRNALPVHAAGHSYGAATLVLMAAQDDVDLASVQLLAPVVPLDYSLLQTALVPLIAPAFIGTANEAEGVFGGMFLSEARMQHWYETYASQPFSEEKPGLIAGDGLSPRWQTTLEDAYRRLGEENVPTTIVIARYDNVVVPARQRAAASLASARVEELETGHYVQLGNLSQDIVNILWFELQSAQRQIALDS